MKLEVQNDIDKRLDVFIKENSNYSRTYIVSLIEDGFVTVNDKVVYKSSYKTKANDIIECTEKEIEVLNIEPQNIPINIIYEDDDILLVNKERGMVVHPSNGHYKDTLVNAIMYHCKDKLSTINGIVRPGIVHRIDKDTSGILCVCKNDNSHRNIALQFKEHTNVRKYKAIVRGVVKEDSGVINLPIGRDKRNRLKYAVDKNGKNAITKYKVIERYKNYTYIECELLTGRTHQIRVHFKEKGFPLLGDTFYGKIDKDFKDIDGQILHAYYLEIDSPSTNKRLKFESELPKYFIDVINRIKNNEK